MLPCCDSGKSTQTAAIKLEAVWLWALGSGTDGRVKEDAEWMEDPSDDVLSYSRGSTPLVVVVMLVGVVILVRLDPTPPPCGTIGGGDLADGDGGSLLSQYGWCSDDSGNAAAVAAVGVVAVEMLLVVK